jgi:hypothetical protein
LLGRWLNTPPYTDAAKKPGRNIMTARAIIDVFQIFFILMPELRSANVVIFQLGISQFPDTGYKIWSLSPE